MKHDKRSIGVNIGSASIVMIFAILCLTIFSALSFVTANHERKLAEKSANAVQQYYQADWQCEERYQQIYKVLQDGFHLDALQELDVQVETSGDVSYLAYAVDIDDRQQIQVHLTVLPEGKILMDQWKVVATTQWQYDDHINVWDGQ